MKSETLQPDIEWIGHREAAAIMRVNERNLRQRGPDGLFLFYPDIARWQPGGPRTRLFVSKADVVRWIERSQAEARDLLPRETQIEMGAYYASALPTLRRLGADRVIKALGVKA